MAKEGMENVSPTVESGQKPTSIPLMILIIALQVAGGYGLFYLARILWIPAEITNRGEFMGIMAAMAGSFALSAFLFGLLGLALRKVKPSSAGLRILGSLGGALIPVLVLAYLGFTVGFEDLKSFQDVVVARLIPYYTNLSMIIAVAGFYAKEWLPRMVKPKPKAQAKADERKAK